MNFVGWKMNTCRIGINVQATIRHVAIVFLALFAIAIISASFLLCSCDLIAAMRVKSKPVTAETMTAIHNANLWLFEDSGLCPGSRKKDYNQRKRNDLRPGSNKFWIGMSFAPVSSAIFSGTDTTGMREITGKKGVRVIEVVGDFRFCIGNGPNRFDTWLGYSQDSVSRVEFLLDPDSLRILGERYYYAPPPPPKAGENALWEIAYEYGSGADTGKLKRIVAQYKDTSKGSKTKRFEMTVIHRGNKILLDKSEYYFGGEHSSTYTPSKGAD